jgi:hypothetical protein
MRRAPHDAADLLDRLARRAHGAQACAAAAGAARWIGRQNSWHRTTAAAADGETGRVVKAKRKAKRKAKAKRQRPPSLATALRELTRTVKGQDEQMRLWEMKIRGTLVQLAGVIAEQHNVPALLRRLATQENDLAALRIRLGVRRSEYVPEPPGTPDASCEAPE